MNGDWVSPLGAAKRLGVSVDEVLRLVKRGKLQSKRDGEALYISRESIYKHSGLKMDGLQTTSRRVRKLATVDRDEAARMLKGEDVDRLVFRGELELFEDAITRRSVEAYLRRSEERKEKAESSRRVEVETPAAEELPRGKESQGGDDGGYKKDGCRGDFYSEEELKEALRIAYMKGRLDVYESLKSFERR